MLQAAIFVIFPFCMAFAAVSDMLSMTIANRVSALLIISFAVLAPLTGMEWAQYGMHFATFAALLATTFALFALGGMGGGDAKLIAATGLWFGFSPALAEYLVYSTLAGGALTIAILLFRKSDISVITANNLFLRNFADSSVGVPYGIALGFGGLMAFAGSPLVVWALASLAH